MTAPYYNADLYPGMIADYRFADDNEVNIRLWEWLRDTLQGPFVIKGPSTAHSFTHIQISDPDDEQHINKVWTLEKCEESTRGGATYPQGRMPHGVALDRCKIEPIYFGDQCINLASWIERNALPVAHVSHVIHTHRLESEKQSHMRELAHLWKHVVHSDLKLIVPFSGNRNEALEWCEKNCEESFKSFVIPLHVQFRSTLEKKDMPKQVFFFECDRDAILFKTFNQ